MKRKSNNIGDILLAKLEAFGNWLVKHAKIVMPLVLIACVAVTVIVSVNANKRGADRQENVEANSNLGGTADNTPAIPQVPLQKNEDPKIEELINSYYTAMVNNDIDTIRSLVENLDDSEVLQIQETSKYTESYPTVDIYTKEGPTDNAVLVYVCLEVKFTDFEKPIPGMRSFYVHIDENDDYRIVEDKELPESEANYIKIVSLQDDVVDMNNRVVAAYNDMVASDADLAEFLLDLGKEIEKNVGQVLVETEESTDTPEESVENTEADAEGGDAQTEQTAEAVVTKVRAVDVVNIRSSDSETADKLGKAAIGDEFKLLEKIGNGWSKIEYEGSEAYIKSEFLEDVETEEASAAGETNAGQGTPVAGGTVTVKENVRIRSGASENSEKIGVAYAGDKLEAVMKRADGWTEIKYNGKTAYVKSDYVE
ncbi:MAG: SH3 domain-containing protein [Bacillus sp. (in: Bacteria)]|nr:SH3 domain-containing protein [Bacillus sp. (in: firmicutes)]MCM1427623.1 SH3 domain-containing protein [Eubacterium sp.]